MEAQFDQDSVWGQKSDLVEEEEYLIDRCDEFLVTEEGLVLSFKTGEPVPASSLLQVSVDFEMCDNLICTPTQVDQIKTKYD